MPSSKSELPKISVAVIAAIPLSLKVFMRPHLEAMADRYEVTAICSPDGAAETFFGGGVCFLGVDIRRKVSLTADLAAFLRLVGIFRRKRFHIVHSLTPKAGLLSMLAAYVARVPLRVHIFTGQVWVTRHGVRRYVLKFFDRLIAALATHLLADSPSQCRFLVAEGVVSETRIRCLADGSICGVDAHRFHPDSAVRERVRQSLGIPADALIVLFLGRLTRDKGVLDLARAYAELAVRYPSLYLLCVGPDEGGLRHVLDGQLIAYYARVRFVGITDVPQDYMAAADIFALPSYREGFGSTILEAAACGLPAVASRIYGLTDAVADGVTGILHEPGDIADLAGALDTLIADAECRIRMGIAARARILEKFTVGRLVSAHLAFYDQILTAEEMKRMQV